MKFTTVAFDLDGTLYPDYRLNGRLVPFLLKHQRLLRAMGKARDQIRTYLENAAAGGGDLAGLNSAGGAGCVDGSSAAKGKSNAGANPPNDGGDLADGVFWEDFYDFQAALMSEILGLPADEIREKTERLIYRGWEPLFKKIRLFPHVRETLDIFRAKGIRLGLLSDFPPETKLRNLKIDGYWQTVLCSEQTGRLKPDAAPFLELAKRMEAPPGEILYVGNSVSYDVEGALNAGMKAALVRPRWKKALPPSLAGTPAPRVFIFHDYRQLLDYVLS